MSSMQMLFLILATTMLTGHAAPQPLTVTGTNLVSGEATTILPGHQGLVVVFLSSRCPCSKSHTDELKALAKDFPTFHFVAVHSNRDEDKSVEYFSSLRLPFPILQDEASSLANRFKALKTPHAFVYDSSGNLVYQGGMSDSHNFPEAHRRYLREALDDLSHERKVRTAEGRTLGCVIQR